MSDIDSDGFDIDPGAVAAELLALEPLFHRSPPGSDRAHFEAMTAPEFWEVGASGNVYSRELVLDVVTARYADPAYVDPPLTVSDFAVRALAPGVYLATYHLVQHEPEGDRPTRRSTVWRRAPSGWQLLYHQGTIIGGDPGLHG